MIGAPSPWSARAVGVARRAHAPRRRSTAAGSMIAARVALVAVDVAGARRRRQHGVLTRDGAAARRRRRRCSGRAREPLRQLGDVARRRARARNGCIELRPQTGDVSAWATGARSVNLGYRCRRVGRQHDRRRDGDGCAGGGLTRAAVAPFLGVAGGQRPRVVGAASHGAATSRQWSRRFPHRHRRHSRASRVRQGSRPTAQQQAAPSAVSPRAGAAAARVGAMQAHFHSHERRDQRHHAAHAASVAAELHHCSSLRCESRRV